MNEKLVRSLKKNPVKYAHLIGLDLLTDIHNEWIREMAFSHEDKTLLGHRGSYKTTCLSVAIALIMVLMPDKSIIFTRKTDDDVIEIIRQVDKILRTEVFIYIVRELYGIDLAVMSSAFRISTNLYVSASGTPQLLGLGIGASLTGKHADIIFTDDIVNVRDRASRAERERTKLQYQELQNIKNRDGRIFNTGTPWHKDDAISMMPNVQRYDCYSTGLISKEKLSELRQSMSSSLFAANYELKHIADKDALFTDPTYISDAKEIYGGIGHVDAAYGGGDYTAWTGAKKTDDGYVMIGKLWHKHVDECIAEIKWLHKHYRLGSISCEKNADKGYLANKLRDEGMYVRSYNEHTNKFIKISSHLKPAWRNIKWLEDTDPEYMNQVLDFTEYAENDDAPDSAACVIREYDKRVTYHGFKGGI